MKLISVKSSNIQQIGYEENFTMSLSSRKTSVLRIVFTSGFTYDYYNVPQTIFKEFLQSESIGKYFWANIKDKYNYEKVK